MRPDVFFILALPRSRTSWLANFLTYDVSFCLHDGLRHCEKIEDLRNLFANLAIETDAEFVGDSDSFLPIFHAQLLELFPQAKFLFIRRTAFAASNSYYHFVADEPYNDQVYRTPKEITEEFKRLDSILQSAYEATPPNQRLTLHHTMLDQQEHAERAWNFCLPGTQFPQRRWEQLNAMRVNPIPAKTPIDWLRTARLLASANHKSEILNHKYIPCPSEP